MNHLDEIIALLKKQIGNSEEVDDIKKSAERVSAKWVKPLTGGKEETNGLIYGFVQSGKTGVLTVTGAIGADEGYNTIMILTSDNDPLYAQTLGRVKEAFPGIDILGKADFRDADAFLQRIKGSTCAIVTTKNSGILKTLIQNFKKGNVKGLKALIIDDEADQASLNTRAAKDDGSVSAINERIAELRQFFEKNTYLQVTATPQALFLQTAQHAFRPKFTVLSNPGAAYVGGADFFGDGSKLVREFPLADITALGAGSQPTPGLHLPKSLQAALDTFVVGATFKRKQQADENCAFLCHVSTLKVDHNHIVDLLRQYKMDLQKGLATANPKVVARLKEAYGDLAATHAAIKEANFDQLVEQITFYAPGINVTLVNGDTDDDVAVKSPLNLFVGGNKLGRGVTIKNLLVSYYGRNPKRPQADTVLQHARMYGYRRKDIGLLRLFLPKELRVVFRAVDKMERGLRDLIATNADEEFRGVYVESGISPTRKNVLAPGSVGVYSGGSIYNPAQVLRNHTVAPATSAIDKILKGQADKTYVELPIADLKALIERTMADPAASEHVWNPVAVASSLDQFAKLHNQATGYVYLDRERGLKQDRRETQGILDGGEQANVPKDRITLFLLRTKPEPGQHAAWWPQIRFPAGRYAFAFAI